jgi:flagellum-specific ATP synthase
MAQQVIKILSTYARSRMLIESGMYTRGSDPDIDRAITLYSSLNDYLQQAADERLTAKASSDLLGNLLGDTHV